MSQSFNVHQRAYKYKRVREEEEENRDDSAISI